MRRLLSLTSSLPEMNYHTHQTNEKEEEEVIEDGL